MIENRELFRSIQKACSREMWSHLNERYGYQKAPLNAPACHDCGTSRHLVRDHRSYDDPHAVEVVCRHCNFLRGPAKATFVDVETLQQHDVWHRWNSPGHRPKRTRAEAA